MPEGMQDLFISHAGSDKSRYIEPLANALAQKQITFWLDNVEIGWGDSIPLRINEGLRKSRYVLLCLSRGFLRRPWPEAELAAALAIQNGTGQKRVLPLILNSKDLVLKTYPLLAALAYKEYSEPADLVAQEVAKLVNPQDKTQSDLHVVVESVHTGKLCNIYVSPRVSVKWLSDQAQQGLGVSDRAETGAYEAFRVKWVLVDTTVEDAWLALPRRDKRLMSAVLRSPHGPRFCTNDRIRLQDAELSDGTVFHLYAIEDERYGPLLCAD